MATIETRKRKDGSVAYTARIRIKRAGVIVHQEAKTFDARRFKRKDVERWASAREHELHAPDAVLGPQSTLTLGQAIARYCREYPGWGRSKSADLARLQSARIASLPIVLIRPQHLIEHVRTRRASVGPATAGNDLIWLRVLYRVAARAWRVPVAVQTVDDAVAHCREQRLIGRARQRDRRPTLDELTRLIEWWQRGDGRLRIPMDELVLFAVFSARRQEEICQLRREDYDPVRSTILVRDAKHPRDPAYSVRVSLTPEAVAVLQRQPDRGPLYFPFNGKSVQASFARACKMLGITDLHFHDLRHEAASRLAELGWTIPQMASVTGHRTWANLQRYTHLAGPAPVDKYAGWGFRPGNLG